MKKTSVRKKSENKRDNMRPQYRFDYGKAKPNRFAAKMRGLRSSSIPTLQRCSSRRKLSMRSCARWSPRCQSPSTNKRA